MRRGWLALALLLAGCSREPDIFAPPVQRQPLLSGQVPTQAKRIIRMAEAEADAYIVKDLPRGESGSWRWTGKRPTVRMYIANTEGLKLFTEFSIAEATFKDTGPVALQFLINGELLDSQKYDKPGNYTFERPVPGRLLKPATDNELAIEIDKVWVAPTDGAKLGFLLTSIGLIR